MGTDRKNQISRRRAIQLLGSSVLASSIPFPLSASEKNMNQLKVLPLVKKGNFFAYRSFWPEFEAMKQFRASGVNTVSIFAANTDNSLGKPYSKYPPVWRWFDKYDFGSLNRQFDDVLEVNPDAEFICLIDLNSPAWLHRQLSLRGQSAESESFTMLSNTCSNPDWVKHITDYLIAVVGHMEARYGSLVKAYALLGGQTDEWMDYSNGVAGRTKTKAWSDWLKDKEKQNVPVPSYERIDRASFNNLIRDPEKEQDIIDYFYFTGDLIAKTVLKFAKTIRELISKDKQIGMFFGYVLELTQSRLVRAGHLEYEQLYVSPDIDFFISPGTYSDRQMGGGSGFMVPNGTRILNGKGFLHEIDHRTPTYNTALDEYVSIGWMVPWKDQAETTAGLKREFSLAVINHASLWCFDMWGGVFKTPETMKIVGQSKKIWDKYNNTGLKSLAEVALVVDPQSARLINDLNPVVKEIYQGTRNKLNRLGAPFDVFSFNDLEKADFNQYKLVVFPGLFEVTHGKKEILDKHVFNNNRAVLFIYAPGISNGGNLDVDRVKELTGTPFNTPGITKVQRNVWVSVYSPDYDTVTPKILKQIALEAGATIWCNDEIPVFANEKLVAVHTAEGGKKTITLPVNAKEVKELYTGKTIPVYNKRFTCDFSTPDTTLFEII